MVGRWTGMQNFVGNFARGVAPALTGYLLDRSGEFYWPFLVAAAVAAIGALFWTLMVGPIEEVKWDAKSPNPIAVPVYTAPQSARS